MKISENLTVIESLEKSWFCSDVINNFNISKSTLYTIKSMKNKILHVQEALSHKSDLKKRTLHQPKLSKPDRVLWDLFVCKRSEGMPISGLMLKTKSNSHKTEMNIYCKFTFSDDCLRNFKCRHGIRQLSVSDEKLAAADTKKQRVIVQHFKL